MARSPDIVRVDDRASDGTRRASEIVSQHILQHRFIQAQLRHQLRQSGILFLQMSAGPDRPKSQCTASSTGKMSACWSPPFADQLRHRYSHLGLLQRSAVKIGPPKVSTSHLSSRFDCASGMMHKIKFATVQSTQHLWPKVFPRS
jgi:hypothetical protein